MTCVKLKKIRERKKVPHTKNNNKIFDHISLSNGIYEKNIHKCFLVLQKVNSTTSSVLIFNLLPINMQICTESLCLRQAQGINNRHSTHRPENGK